MPARRRRRVVGRRAGPALAVAAAIVALAFAGCATDADEDVHDDAHDDVPMLQGYVFDEAQRPLAGATVEVQATGNTTATDAGGHYVFEDAPLDEVIIVVATLATYRATSKQVVLHADAPVQVNFTLVAIPVKVPYVDVVQINAHLQCQGAASAAGFVIPLQCGGGELDSWDVAPAPDLAGVVVEVAWTAGTPLAARFTATLETLSLGDLNHVLAEATGESVLRLEVTQDVTRVLYPSGGLMRVSVAPAVSPEEPSVSLHVSQDVQLFVSFFYVDPPLAGYTVGA
jgi:hypothetical protein